MDFPNNKSISPSQNEGVQISLLLLGIIFVAIGQSLSRGIHLGTEWGPGIILGIGVLLFILAAQSFLRKELNPRLVAWLIRSSHWFGLHPHQILLIFSAPILSLAAWLASGDQLLSLQPVLGIITWLIAIFIFLIGHQRKQTINPLFKWQQQDTYIMLLLFTMAVVLRGVVLEDIPWLLSGDEGSAGLTAVEFIQGHRDNIFVSGWFSFPSLFFWIQSISIKIFGQTTFGVRFPSVIAGALTIPALFWSIRPFLGRLHATASAAFLAAFHFHIHFSRIGLNNVWDGLFAVLLIGLVWRAWTEVKVTKSRTSSTFALAGIILGLSQYFYTSSRAIAGVLILFVLTRLIIERELIRDYLQGLVSTLLGTLVTLLPLASFYLLHPEQFLAPFARTQNLGIWLQEEISITGEAGITILANKLKQAALAFTHENLRGFYKPDEPMLLTIPAVLFILGIIILLLQIRKPLFQWLLLWLGSAITITVLSESTPSAQRLTFVAPAVAIIVTLPLKALFDWFSEVIPHWKKMILTGLAVILGIALIGDLSFYFGSYSDSQRYGDTNTEVAQGVANYINSVEGSPTVYFLGFPRMGYYTHSSIPYLAPQAHGEDVVEPLSELPTELNDGIVVYVFLPERIDELELVRSANPEGEVKEFLDRDNEPLFTTYTVSPP